MFFKVFALSLTTAGVALLSACQVTVVNSASSLEEVEKVERARLAAWTRADLAAIRPMLAEDIVYCHSSGQCQNKQELLAFLGSSNSVYHEMEVLQLTPRAVGGAVVINGKLKMRVETNGRMDQFQGIYTDVYVKRDGRWQLASWQSTRLP